MHKIFLEKGAEFERLDLLSSLAVVRRVDYGAFELLVVDELKYGGRARLASGSFDFRDELDLIVLNDLVLDTRTPEATLSGLPPLLRLSSPGTGALPTDAGLYLLQFIGPPKDAWIQAAESMGAKLVQSVSSNAYVVQIAPQRVSSFDAWAQRSSDVQFAGALEPAFRLHAELRQLLEAQSLDAVKVTIQIVQGPGSEAALRDVRFLAAELLNTQHVGPYLNVEAILHPVHFSSIALLAPVFQIEPLGERQGLDEAQGQIVAGNVVGNGPTGPGYLAWLAAAGFNSTQFSSFSVNVVDDSTTLLGHPDLSTGRVDFALNPTGQGGLEGGHGFLNANIIAGFNNATGAAFEDPSGYNYGLGIAPWAHVGSTAIFGAGGLNPTSYEASAYGSGARISSNSWGFQNGFGGPVADYNASSQEFDIITRDAQSGVAGNQEYLVVFAAGNDGSGANTVSSPGTAKNVLTVGASENQRQTGFDGCGIANSGADNINDMIGFSSRGPVNSGGGDGRWKPEIVAPGTHIQAGIPQSNYGGTGVCNKYWPLGQTLYGWSSGTSHSTPAVAGGAALVRQWFLNQGLGAPSPAMVKAVLVNGSSYMTGVGANDTLPSNSQGMGRMDLGRMFDGAGRVFEDQNTLLGASGAVHSVNATITDVGKPVRITLTWTDAPGSTIGAPWVNDLDLRVTVGAVTYRGNVFSGAFSTPGGVSDTRNNTESIFLPAGTSGSISISVSATSIAGDGVPGNGDTTDQDFALCVYNASVQTGPIAPTAGFSGTPLSGSTPLQVSFSDQSSGTPTSWAWSFGDGATSALQNPSHTYATAGSFSVGLTVTNAIGSNNLTRPGYVNSVQGPPAGQGFQLASTADLAVDTRVFAPTDTIFMQVFDDVRDLTNPKRAQWEIVDANGKGASGNLSSSAIGTLTGNFALSGLPNASTSWTWFAFIEDASGNRFEYSAPITVVAGGGTAPTAGFSAVPTSGSAPLDVSFTDTSTGFPTGWSWNFGDGASSTQQSPSHVYTTPGTYSVALTASNASGTDTSTQLNLITVTVPIPVAPSADFSGTPTSGAAPLVVSFSDQSSGIPTSWAWTFGDGGTSTLQDPSHTYTAVGSYTVSLTVTNAQGSNAKTSVAFITVADVPVGEGYVLSKNPAFSTNDTVYVRADTLYMKVFSNLLDPTDIKKAQWVIQDAGGKSAKGGLTDNGDGTFTASLPLSSLPTAATSWTWSAFVEDGNGLSTQPSAVITVNP